MMKSAINPLDGRYFEKTRALAPYFSEEALMGYRVMMEGEYLIALSLSRKTAPRHRCRCLVYCIIAWGCTGAFEYLPE